ncbi:ARF guanine-nucleotide exchange factor GNOM-like [Chlorella sorokiniana]|uniref:ARF guanine-nucleotide exchange factor GNOM-like n=1 Tax=Chlorella sorokiniana TaxID=3076 RepID=A0A2P6TUU3_CHLSO|nr:ARF guanine-nucleotide exchange factor GNOM-like [Chlorella sorokiniana]|eukprot:PRW57821.1 ARF guanine-nucleotide exchange factor GNOM-like [Chlorella sorokiniana]
MEVPPKPALLLAGEAAAVIAALRSNLKFNRYAQEEELEDPLVEEFKALRRKLFAWQRWEAVEPLEYLTPFLETVKSPETSGPITLVALSALHKILARGVLGGLGGPAAAEAIQAVADGVTQCKFEATYPASDECVLHRILDVLVACVGCPAGAVLTNDNLITIFQACYRIGHFQTEKGRDTSELLTQASRAAMAEMVHHIFSRLDVIPEPVDSPFAAPAAAALSTRRLQVSPVASRGENASTEEGEGGQAAQAGGSQATEGSSAAALRALQDGAAAAGEAADTAEPPAAAPAAGEAVAAAEGAAVGAAVAAAALDAGLSAEAAVDAAAAAAAEAAAEVVPIVDPTAPQEPPPASPAVVSLLAPLAVPASGAGAPPSELGGYGVDAVREVLLFIISLIGSAPVGAHHDLPAHGLNLMNTALQAAGSALEGHDSLLVLLQQDLVRSMFAAARHPSLPCLAGICQVSLALYVHLGPCMLLQIEALLSLLLLPMAEGKAPVAAAGHSPAAAELQQVALEGVLDFCAQPHFVRDVYLNLDCRIERSNLFEQLCGLLSKAAFPTREGPLSAAHLQSLDGILGILTSLSASCSGVSDLDAGSQALLADPPSYLDIWTPLSRGSDPPLEQMLPAGSPATAAELARVEKFLKGRLAAAAEHFNRDSKKGFQYLQSLKLLPRELDAPTLARFLRACPGLAKPAIGEILGERDAFYEDVRAAYMQTFDFTGLDFDLALRLFMDAFRPPGEGQKIDRIMQAFGKRYYEVMPSMGLKSTDAAYVLAFSVIMLNTDLHNTQNKKKMSLDDFARINRSTNEGEPMPAALLETIYSSISRDELKISSESSADELPSVFWYQLAVEARRPRGRMLPGARTSEALERDMFGLVWGPTLAAASVVLDSAADAGAVQRALDCLLLAARMAAYHQVDEVCDTIVAQLARFSAALAPSPKGAAALGESGKACLALEAMFSVANRYGDWLRSGWRNVVDVVLRLHRLDLLPPAVIAADGEDPEDARRRFPRPASLGKAKGSSSSLFSRAITSLISIEGSDGMTAEQAAQREAELAARAAACVEACHVDEVFADSKFLTAESLVELVKAVMWAAGNVAAAARSGENTGTAELCLELLIALALRNRDRAGLIWPLLHEYLAACTAADHAVAVNPLVERAVTGLLRICQRLLPYKEDTAETLLRSLKLIIGLSPGVAWEMAEGIAAELLALLRSSAPYVRSEADWRTVCAIIKLTSVRPEAAPLAYECLSVVCSSPRALSGEAYLPLLETCLQFIERYKQQNVEAAVRYLDLVEALFSWLVTQSQRRGSAYEEGGLSDEQLVDLWLTTVGVLARSLCKDEAQPLRDNAIMVLSRALGASEQLHLPPELWVQTLRELLVPVVTDLSRLAGPKARSHPGADKSVRLAVSMLLKTLLQYIEVIQSDKDFYGLWDAVLRALQDCMAVRHEAVQESVPEAVKNMLLVLGSSGVLTPQWRDAAGRSLWDLTFGKVHMISSGLNPGMLEATLAPREEPHPHPPRHSSEGAGAAAAVAEVPGAVPAAVLAAGADAQQPPAAQQPGAEQQAAAEGQLQQPAAPQEAAAAPEGSLPAVAAQGAALPAVAAEPGAAAEPGVPAAEGAEAGAAPAVAAAGSSTSTGNEAATMPAAPLPSAESEEPPQEQSSGTCKQQ